MQEQITCCFCGATETGMGHNPAPIAPGESIREEDRCCGACNNAIVIPTRLALAFIDRHQVNKKEKSSE